MAVLFGVGAALLQLSWALAIPAFMGNDEIDHAYRASEVVRGHWGPPAKTAQHGVGDLVRVAGSTVRAAEQACEAVEYYGTDNCTPVKRYHDGSVEVASSAARYSPVYYWLVSIVAKPFQGVAGLYAMRVTTILLCSTLLALAAYCVTRWARTIWPFVGFVVALTPVTIYSGSVVAPNGVEIAAAVWLWAALLGLRTQRFVPDETTVFIRHAGVAAVVLVLPRTLGPFWLVAIVCTCAVALGRLRVRQVIGVRDWRSRGVWGVVLVAVAWAGWWDLVAGPNLPSTTANLNLGSPWRIMPGQIPLWLLQTIAAFPRRHDPAPSSVYLIWILMFSALVVVAWRKARTDRALLMTLALGLLLPVAMTVPTYSTVGAVWQGRYGLPYLAGIPLAAAWVLDQKRGLRAPRGLVLIGTVAVTLAHSVSMVHASHLASSRLARATHTDVVSATPGWILIAMAVVGCGSWLCAMALARYTSRSVSITA